MTRLKAILGVILLCGVATFARAEDELAPGYDECNEKAESMADNIECATKAYLYWDKVLNANFKKAQGVCAASVENAEQCKKDLLKAQRLWIQYKEAMAQVIGHLVGGGSLSRLEANIFAARETRKQAELLSYYSSIGAGY